jgi:hypothetical protein
MAFTRGLREQHSEVNVHSLSPLSIISLAFRRAKEALYINHILLGGKQASITYVVARPYATVGSQPHASLAPTLHCYCAQLAMT